MLPKNEDQSRTWSVQMGPSSRAELGHIERAWPEKRKREPKVFVLLNIILLALSGNTFLLWF